MTRLDIINAMLGVVGEIPVTTLTTTHPSVLSAIAVFDRVNESVQAVGWWFNDYPSVTLSVGTDGKILLPENCLSVDSVNESDRLVQQGRYLHDMKTMSDTFTTSKVVSLRLLKSVENIPIQAADYIRAMSVLTFFVNEDGEGSKLRELERNVQMTFEVLNAENLRILGVNAINCPTVARTMYPSVSRGAFPSRY